MRRRQRFGNVLDEVVNDDQMPAFTGDTAIDAEKIRFFVRNGLETVE